MARGGRFHGSGGAAGSYDLLNEDIAKARRSARNLWTIRHLLPYLWPKGRSDLKFRVVFSLSTLIIAQTILAISPLLFGNAVDTLTKNTGVESATMVAIAWVLGYGLSRILMMSVNQVRDAVFARVGQNAQRAIAVETFAHLHQLSLRYHLERQTGGLARLITRGTSSIELFLRVLLFSVGPTIVQVTIMIGLFFLMFGWEYALVIVLLVAVYVWFSIRITEWRNKFYREMIRTDAEAGNKSIDSLLNFETVKYFNNEKWETDRFGVAAAAYAGAAEKSTKALALLNVGQAVIISVGTTILLVMAVFDVQNSALSVGAFASIMLYLVQLQQPLNMLGFVYREITQAFADMERMFGLRNIAVEVADAPDAKDIVVGRGEIRFENVSFAYDPERQILEGLSFNVPAGKTVAVVGPSGAGKSTLGRLLFRFYDVQSGRILIDGQDVRDVTQLSLRQSIGIVPQDTVLFNDTIRYNIAYGRPEASQAEIEEAAKIAQIHKFILGQPDGFDSEVGERGLKLSGGEKQRVAIARTVLKAPPILLLDEATSALDTHTEEAIQSALEEISKGRTTLVIAHRLSTIINADQIIVLDHGKIAEQGTHQELLRGNGLYAQLWRRQREIDEITHRLHEMESAPEASNEFAETGQPQLK